MSSVMTLEQVNVTSPATITPPSAASPNGLDAYPHGWRYVRRSANGEDNWVRVPLKREDVLHPQLGDKKVHSEYHERFSTYLYDVLTEQVANDPHAVVLHDVGIMWNDPDLKHHAPDIAVIFDVRQRKEWHTFHVAKEGTKPTLIIEVTSPSNRSTDVADKLDEYEVAGVPLYIIVDTYRYRGKLRRRLLGYQLDSNGNYRVMMPNEKGWLWLGPVSLWISIENHKVVCYDAAGKPIADYVGMVAQRDQAWLERKAAQTKAQEAEQQARAETRARKEAEQQARAEAHARKEAEQQAQAAHAEIERLLAELARLRGSNSP